MDRSLIAGMLCQLPGAEPLAYRRALVTHRACDMDAWLSLVRRARGLCVPFLSPLEPRGCLASYGRANRRAIGIRCRRWYLLQLFVPCALDRRCGVAVAASQNSKSRKHSAVG